MERVLRPRRPLQVPRAVTCKPDRQPEMVNEGLTDTIAVRLLLTPLYRTDDRTAYELKRGRGLRGPAAVRLFIAALVMICVTSARPFALSGPSPWLKITGRACSAMRPQELATAVAEGRPWRHGQCAAAASTHLRQFLPLFAFEKALESGHGLG
jgi:hypothetical protein